MDFTVAVAALVRVYKGSGNPFLNLLLAEVLAIPTDSIALSVMEISISSQFLAAWIKACRILKEKFFHTTRSQTLYVCTSMHMRLCLHP